MDSKRKKKYLYKFVAFDYLAALIAWFLFVAFRKIVLWDALEDPGELLFDSNMTIGLIVIPIFWLFLYWLGGTYKTILRTSRLGMVGQTLMISVIGVLVISFALLFDLQLQPFSSQFLSFLFLLGLHFFLAAAFRVAILTGYFKKIRSGIIGFPTLIVGSGKKAVEIYSELKSQGNPSGNRIVGFIGFNGPKMKKGNGLPPELGSLQNVKSIVGEYKIEEVIIALEDDEHEKLPMVILAFSRFNVTINVIPDIHDFLLGAVKMSSIFGTPLIKVRSELLPPWQQSLKRLMDIVASLFCLVVLSPVFLFTAIMVKLSSKGTVLYKHERIGLHGKPFMMHKFRSMYVDAEKAGPQLSSKDDPRITPWGRFMRKVRLDEIPQFFNVLLGTMSLVGPRPERQFYIDQIVEKAPHYLLLQKIKPGITSWGQVKYGYAENVDEMVERLKYDLLYLENMSLAVDLKILIYTFLIIVQGRGK